LRGTDKALFVEEEIGRIFCSESCIASYFAPEIERLEKEYVRRSSAQDLTGAERESLAHLRWVTLQEPDEVWREKTLSGDYRYTLISEFEPGDKKVWSICICLFLRGEPSFLYLAFPTRNAAVVHAYRRGERVELGAPAKEKDKAKRRKADAAAEAPEAADGAAGEPGASDRLGTAWTEDETFLAQVNQERSEDDIPPEDFESSQGCIEETLEVPDEVWSVKTNEGMLIYHFIRQYPADESGLGHWYVIVARETEEEEQIEILDAFPTRDAVLVDRYRRGSQQVGETQEERPVSRVVH
jgi:hypothetical protein